MTQVILDSNAITKLGNLTHPVEVCDQAGHVLGRFVPRSSDDDVLATGELVDRIMAEDDANDPYLESYQSYARKGDQ